MIKLPYAGAGILFLVMTNKTPEILLGKRRRSCVGAFRAEDEMLVKKFSGQSPYGKRKKSFVVIA